MKGEAIKSFYQKNGYIVVKGILRECSEHYCARLDKAIKDMAHSIDTTEEQYLSAVCRWDMPCDIVNQFKQEIAPIIEPLVSGILGREVEIVRASVIRKSGIAEKGTHGHQDSGYWLVNKSDTYDMTSWIAFGNVDSSNGALQVLPNSYSVGPQEQEDFLSEAFIDPVKNWGDEAKTLNMSVGDMVLFSPDLWHASHECQKDKTRIAFIMRWSGIPSVFSAAEKPEKCGVSSTQFGMQTSGYLLKKTLVRLVEDAGLSLPDSPTDLIGFVLSHNLTSTLPEPDKANTALSKLRILNLAKSHGGNDLGIGIWEDIRDFVVETDRVS